MIKLKPCPFCWGKALLLNLHGDTVKHLVRCTKCGCKTPYYTTEEEAIETWNRRVKMRLRDLFHKPKLCDKCKNLRSKTGRKYVCTFNAWGEDLLVYGVTKGISDSVFVKRFTKAPSYCKFFESREV